MREIETEMVIFGSGIAGLSTAFEAGRRGINSILLDNGIPGTTNAATGILDARPDHLPWDRESVERTSEEITIWTRDFPHLPRVIMPKYFLMPIGPDTPYSIRSFECLLKYYRDIAKKRFRGLPDDYTLHSGYLLEKMEPNLRKNYFEKAFGFWLWTADPKDLMRKIRNEATMFSPHSRRLSIKEILSFELSGNIINSVVIKNHDSETIKIKNSSYPLIIANTSGPFINKVLEPLGVAADIKMNIGVQATVPGCFFHSGILNFASDGKYLIFLQKANHLQIGPTNARCVDNFEIPDPGGVAVEYLQDSLKTILEDNNIGNCRFLKAGIRIKPNYIFDTDRPVVWCHDKEGIDNLYTAHPGKMALGLLTARELFDRLANDGWIKKTQNPCTKPLTLDGNKPVRNQFKLLMIRIISLFFTGLRFIKPLKTQKHL